METQYTINIDRFIKINKLTAIAKLILMALMPIIVAIMLFVFKMDRWMCIFLPLVLAGGIIGYFFQLKRDVHAYLRSKEYDEFSVIATQNARRVYLEFSPYLQKKNDEYDPDFVKLAKVNPLEAFLTITCGVDKKHIAKVTCEELLKYVVELENCVAKYAQSMPLLLMIKNEPILHSIKYFATMDSNMTYAYPKYDFIAKDIDGKVVDRHTVVLTSSVLRQFIIQLSEKQ